MIAALQPIKIRPIERPQYASAPDLDTWLRLNHEVCWQWWVRCEQELGSDACERPGAFAEFHDFARAQYDLVAKPAEEDEDDEPVRVYRNRDELEADAAGVRARGEI